MKKFTISNNEVNKILGLNEDHFNDLKSTRIAPAKLTKTISAFSNAEGGDVYIGIEDNPRIWQGFATEEEANGHIQIFDKLFPFGAQFDYAFLKNENEKGLVLKIDVSKTNDIKVASDGIAYVRRGAQSLPYKDHSSLERLKRNKGITSFETELLNAPATAITNSTHIISFMLAVVPTSEPEQWLKKQQLLIQGKPTVAGVLLFSEEPQALLPKQSAIKIYQYKTKEEGERDSLAFNPITIEGNVYETIKKSVKKTQEIIESIRIMTPQGLKKAAYPVEALHEIITNAVLHRDYSIPDDVHVRIYDNRVEVQSPGSLPGHITTENILEERFARNGIIVRLINKFPDPPNKDVGEGLNTAFEAMKKMRLKPPQITQKGMNIVVTLKHELLASPQEIIMSYLDTHKTISNKEARDITGVKTENAMKHTLKKMVDADMLETITGQTVFQTKYKKKQS